MRLLIALIALLPACDRTKPLDTSLEDDTSIPDDGDRDGYAAGEDCNDLDPSVHPSAREICDGTDNDCNGLVDDEDPNVESTYTWYADSDLDGYGGSQLTLEACAQPQGYVDSQSDCNDLNASVNPGADELCDGTDNDCDNSIDEEDAIDPLTWYEDADGDGYGTDNTETACDPPPGFVLYDGDCDDADPGFHPGASETDCGDPNDYNCDGSIGFEDADNDGFAACDDCDDSDSSANDDAIEVCDGIDNDCDGDIDGDDGSLEGATTFYGDADGDSFGGSQFQVDACEAPPGYVTNDTDCNDVDAASHPGASETCDDVDNDCDGDIDEGVGTTWYEDSDADGYGNGSVSADACDAPSGYVANALDCDDFSVATNPASYEVCDGIDNNCDGSTDGADAINATTFYIDSDGDGYGSSAGSTSACDAPTGYASNDQDCDDTDALISPAATEICNSSDDNCNGSTDEGVLLTWYVDADSDGHGDAAISSESCTAPSGYVADNTDCDDTDAAISPSAVEICDANDTDEDCNGTADDSDSGVSDPTTWYADTDSDGHGDASNTQDTCTMPSGYLAYATDCDDTDAAVSPDASEICDGGTDEDCNGTADDNDSGVTDPTTWYVDADSDGYGVATSTVDSCTMPSGYAANDTDCDDSDANIGEDTATNCGLGTGNDGAMTVTASDTVLNRYTAMSGNHSAGSTTVSIAATGEFSAGDEILLIQIQGSNAGTYEFAYVSSVDSSTSLTLTTALANSYDTSGGAQAVRVPNYTDLTVSSGASVTAEEWDGGYGGIVAIRVSGTATIDGTINVDEKGYRGGIQVNNTSHWNGYTGESTFPSSQKGNNSNNVGGGGSSYCYCGEAAGAGGYGTSGGSVSGVSCGSPHDHGQAGSAYGTTDLSSVFFGGGGGGGCRDDTSCEYPPGSDGAGILYLAAEELIVNGTLYARGEAAPSNSSTCDDTIGGAGAGGSIYLISNTLTLGSSVIVATGGASTFISQSSVTTGVGGEGRVRVDFRTLNGNAHGSSTASSDLSAASSTSVGHSEAH